MCLLAANQRSQWLVASGHAIPPMVIRNRKTLYSDTKVGELPGAFYSLTQNGWMNQELFQKWLWLSFLEVCPSCGTITAFNRWFSSDYCPNTICLATKAKVTVWTSLPHCASKQVNIYVCLLACLLACTNHLLQISSEHI